MKTVKTKVKAVTLAIALMATSGAHSADWIQDFYTTAGAAVNVTSGQAVFRSIVCCHRLTCIGII